MPAAIWVRSAHILAQTQRLARDVQEALHGRGVIDQAIGIIRSRGGGTAEEAYDRLQMISQAEHSRVAWVAGTVVEEAVHRGRECGGQGEVVKDEQPLPPWPGRRPG